MVALKCVLSMSQKYFFLEFSLVTAVLAVVLLFLLFLAVVLVLELLKLFCFRWIIADAVSLLGSQKKWQP